MSSGAYVYNVEVKGKFITVKLKRSRDVESFGREPGKIRFDNDYDCPPALDKYNVLLVPPVQLAMSMVTAFLPRIAMLLAFPSHRNMRVFKSYMTGKE